MAQKVSDYLAKQQQAAGITAQTAAYYAAFEELYTKKLWHQLTLKLLAFIAEERPANLVELYENFIIDFESRIKHLSLVEIASNVVAQIPATEEKLKFIEKIKEKVKNDVLSEILCNILTGQLKLASGDLKGAKEIIETTDAMIDTESMGVSNVHARFYQLASEYYQKAGSHADYYRNALRFLGCCGTAGIDVTESEEALAGRAFTLALAAILGEDVYNFGELLLHPIVTKMRPEHAYMRDLLFAFNRGDIAAFEALKPAWSAQTDLAAHEIDMRKKISLLCLMEMAFKAPNGLLTFAEIAQATRLPVGDVELLVMKALSKSLVRCSIDEVAATVRISWVQPRVLNKEQIRGMKVRLEDWIHDVNGFSAKLESRAQEIIA